MNKTLGITHSTTIHNVTWWWILGSSCAEFGQCAGPDPLVAKIKLHLHLTCSKPHSHRVVVWPGYTDAQGPSLLQNFGGGKPYCLRFDDVTMFTQT